MERLTCRSTQTTRDNHRPTNKVTHQHLLHIPLLPTQLQRKDQGGRALVNLPMALYRKQDPCELWQCLLNDSTRTSLKCTCNMASISRGDSQRKRTGVLLGKSKQHIISYHMLSLNTVKAMQRTPPPFFKGVPPGPQYNHNLKENRF